MMPTYLNIFVAYLAWFLLGQFCHAEPDNGFGVNIDWTNLEDGFLAAQEQNKILMLIIHKDSCRACKEFKPKFANSETIRVLSRRLIMVNAEVEVNESELRDEKYHPDGSYVPRILFFEPNGNLMTHVCNLKRQNEKYKYNYSTTDAVVAAMGVALKIGNDSEFQDY